MGHSIPDLARALGKSPVSLRRTLARNRVTAHTARVVSTLFDRLVPNPLEVNRLVSPRNTNEFAADRMTG